MTETYIITAKTVEEAIAIANREYADEKHEISYEIIDMPKKGLFGIGAKDAKIKVTVNDSEIADLGSLVDDIRGMKSLTQRGEEDNKNKDREASNKNNKKHGNNKNEQKQNPQREQKEQNPQKEQKKEEKAPEEKKENRSSLRNQVKPSQRNDRIKVKPTEEINPTGVTVSAPIGISNFTSEKTEGFASGGSSAGRISNDIKKKKNQKPAQPKQAEAPKAEKTEKQVEKQAEKQAEKKVEVKQEEERKRVAVTEAEMQFALEFVNTLIANMKISAQAEAAAAPEGEDYVVSEDAKVYPKINIVGEDAGILIGHHGETLDSLQYLANLSAIRKSKQTEGGDYVKIVVDIENYREKREQTLRALARRMAHRAIKYKRNVFMEPMNAYERHIIHRELQNMENVSTHSVGSDRDRKIIITYEGADKQTENRSRRRRSHDKKTDSAEAPVTKAEKSDRRPKKIKKVPIEQLPEFLAANEELPEKLSEIEY